MALLSEDLEYQYSTNGASISSRELNSLNSLNSTTCAPSIPMVSVKNLRSSIFEATGAAKAASTNDSLCPSLSYQTRVIGFCACFIAGCVLTLLSFTNFVALINGNPVPFVCMYTLGNVLALASSMFLVSPKRQWNSMLDKKRRWTSLVYVVSCKRCKRMKRPQPTPWAH